MQHFCGGHSDFASVELASGCGTFGLRVFSLRGGLKYELVVVVKGSSAFELWGRGR